MPSIFHIEWEILCQFMVPFINRNDHTKELNYVDFQNKATFLIITSNLCSYCWTSWTCALFLLKQVTLFPNQEWKKSSLLRYSPFKAKVSVLSAVNFTSTISILTNRFENNVELHPVCARSFGYTIIFICKPIFYIDFF